jgi:hypothetical protein
LAFLPQRGHPIWKRFITLSSIFLSLFTQAYPHYSEQKFCTSVDGCFGETSSTLGND